jgi:hypothetical protein
MRARRLLALLLGCTAFSAASAAPSDSIDMDLRIDEPRERSWTVHMDNDLFAFADRDRDYTAGFAFSLGGQQAATHPLSLAHALEWVDSKTNFDALSTHARTEGHALELGLLLFTPQDLSSPDALFDDRPYASLAYVSSSKLTNDVSRQVAYQSSLTLGFLGLPLAEHLHRGVHEVFGSEKPMGYTHQVSAGGEPTFRYTVSRQRLLASGSYDERPYSLRLGTGASIGYVTEANAELAFRWGRTSLPWWSSAPASSEYAGQPPIRAPRTAGTGRVEVLFDAGAKVRARLYNSFLQGQFRHSDVVYSSSQLDHVLFEAWLGVTTVLKNRLSISYTVRHQTEELEAGGGARGFTWASVGVAQQF